MNARLGVSEKLPFNPPGITDGVEKQSLYLQQNGGHRQQERMILQKRKTFDRAVYNSYQAAEIFPVGEIGQPHRALINPNITKPDYDDKILSVGYEHNYKPGDVFEWHRPRLNGEIDVSYWIIYLQDLTELAYFKGDIRRCNYWANWRNDAGEFISTWFALRGPVETKINGISKDNISLDTPNHSVHILMPKNKETMAYFKRYSKFYIQGAESLTEKICWRIEATDTLSMPGILEITAVEYYANEHEDDVENGLVGELILDPVKPNVDSDIKGPDHIKPKQKVTYIYSGEQNATWVIPENLPLSVVIEDNNLTLAWEKTYSGTFTISYGTSIKNIKVESLF